MLAREETIGSNYLKNDMTKVLPIVNQGGSDSAHAGQHAGVHGHERYGPAPGRNGNYPRAVEQ